MLILSNRPDVTIGDGCIVGAASVDTKNIPAYHVAAGNPARTIRKVAPEAADAPGFMYEDQGDRVVVLREARKVQEDERRIVGGREELRLLQGAASVTMGDALRAQLGSPPVFGVALVISFGLGYLIGA